MNKRGFSLVELVVVVVVFGLLAAIAIPRFSQGATHSVESDLRTDLAVLRTAIELFYRDHGFYPGQGPAESEVAEAGSGAAFIRQLTQCTDAEGLASGSSNGRFCYGPYLEGGIPPCPVAPAQVGARVLVIRGEQVPAYREASQGAGWVYNCDTGFIAANSSGVDARGIRYDTY